MRKRNFVSHSNLFLNLESFEFEQQNVSSLSDAKQLTAC